MGRWLGKQISRSVEAVSGCPTPARSRPSGDALPRRTLRGGVVRPLGCHAEVGISVAPGATEIPITSQSKARSAHSRPLVQRLARQRSKQPVDRSVRADNKIKRNPFFEDRFEDHPYFHPYNWPDRPPRGEGGGQETARHSPAPNQLDGPK